MAVILASMHICYMNETFVWLSEWQNMAIGFNYNITLLKRLLKLKEYVRLSIIYHLTYNEIIQDDNTGCLFTASKKASLLMYASFVLRLMPFSLINQYK